MKRITIIVLILSFFIIPLSALADSGVDTLESFLYTLSPDLDMSTIESQAQELGLVTKSRKNGVGGKVYRIALNKNVADMNKPTKGSVITLTFDLLKNDSLKDVSYFEERRMISAFWSVNDGYTMIDYNNPSVFSGRLVIPTTQKNLYVFHANKVEANYRKKNRDT